MAKVELEKVGKIYELENAQNLDLKKGDLVVVNTDRGKEIGKVVCPNGENQCGNGMQIIRLATNSDIEKCKQLKEKALAVKPRIEEIAKKAKLEIKIVNVAYTLDGSKILIDFVSMERVDFRVFVKRLASEFRVKIELRQIGSRDETKQLGGIGPCGRVCCCNCYLREFDKVAIKMAKNQNLSLNPSKINGLCGKLMCCLAYENDTYEEMGKTMPKVGSTVGTQMGDGVVMFNDILRQQCTIKIVDTEEYKVFSVKDIKF